MSKRKKDETIWHGLEDLRPFLVPIGKLKLDPENSRKHSERNLAVVDKSLEELGQHRLAVTTGNGTVQIGNAMVAAAEARGWTHIAAIKSGDKGTRAKLRAILDNRSGDPEVGSEWDVPNLLKGLEEISDADFDLGDLGFTEIERKKLVSFMASDLPKEPPLPEAPKVAHTKPGDLWLLGDHRMLCGDATKNEDVGRLMDGKNADCVFTSPPYAVGIDYGIYEDTIENLRTMLPLIAEQWMKIVSPGGYAVVNFGDIVSGSKIVKSDGPCEYPMAIEHWPVFRNAGWVLWTRRIWCKPGAAVGSSRHCIGTNRASSNFEHIWTWKKDGPSIVNDQTTGEYASQNGWFDLTHGVHLEIGLKDHGAGMPLLPALFSISNHSLPGHIVHEPFCGTGTTMIAAEQLGRICYGMEIEPRYCDVICQRYYNLTKDVPVHAETGKEFPVEESHDE